MKKFAGIMVATVLAFSLVACGPVDSAVQNLAGLFPTAEAVTVVW